MKMKKKSQVITPMIAMLILIITAACHDSVDKRPSALPQIESKKLANRLYRITVAGINCVALMDSNGNTLLSDNLKAEHTPLLLQELKRLGSKKITYMTNTHFHDDHCGGNKTIKNAIVIAHENTGRALASDHISTFWQDTTGAVPMHARPDLTFNDRMAIGFGGEDIELAHYPNGHTHSDLVVYFRKSRVLHVSDLLFSIGFPAIDSERGGNVFQFADHLKAILETYPDNVVFVAGHGVEFTRKELADYQKMIAGSASAVQNAMRAGHHLRQIKQSKILDEWKSYANGYFTCDDWAEILFENIRWGDTSSEFFDLVGPTGGYLDSIAPGIEPLIFAPGLISTRASEGCSGFGKDLSEFFFQRWTGASPSLFLTRYENGKWTRPEGIKLYRAIPVYDFTVSPDGSSMVFATSAPIEKFGQEQSGHNIFSLAKTSSGWSRSAVAFAAEINTKYHDSYPTLSNSGNLWFFSNRPGGFGKTDLYFAEFKNGGCQTPVNLGSLVNTEYDEWDPFIAPDESYLIFCSKKPSGLGEDDLYIAFNSGNGRWSAPVHLGSKINTKFSENRPYVSPDGQYLFFTSNRSGNRDIYWVSAKAMLALKSN